jgi:hypothetical protein
MRVPMIAASAFEPIGIRGRYAFGVACFVRVCAAWRWSTPSLDPFRVFRFQDRGGWGEPLRAEDVWPIQT